MQLVGRQSSKSLLNECNRVVFFGLFSFLFICLFGFVCLCVCVCWRGKGLGGSQMATFCL